MHRNHMYTSFSILEFVFCSPFGLIFIFWPIFFCSDNNKRYFLLSLGVLQVVFSRGDKKTKGKTT